MNTRQSILMAVALMAGLGQMLRADVVVNGNFEAGNTGFTSDYVTYAGATGIAAATYEILTNPQLGNGFFSSFGDHTSGSGLMMVVNGSEAANAIVWKEAGLTVVPNTTYQFVAWIASVYPVSPAKLNFEANGVQLGSTFNASGTTGLWQQFSATWFSGLSTTVDLSITNQNLDAQGNDFALDDISFSAQTSTVPEPSSIILMGLGVASLGLLKLRRRS